jgi:hypothetical protein
MRRGLRLGLIAAFSLLSMAALAAGAFVVLETSAFDASVGRVYDLAPDATPFVASKDPEVIARGEHLAKSVAPCAAGPCHAADLGGGTTIDMGPIGVFTGPNISAGGLGVAYSDSELARVVRHGIKKDGRSLRFMPVQDFAWLPDSDVVAIVSWLRTQPAIERPNGPNAVYTLGKILDRRDKILLDVARRIDHDKRENVPTPSPTSDYGAFLARLCTGCHGERLSGGRIPGSPSSIPTPLNLTPDETGLKGWTYDDFDTLMTKGLRKNGKALDPFMPTEAFANFDATEKHALWARLQTLPPIAFGNR